MAFSVMKNIIAAVVECADTRSSHYLRHIFSFRIYEEIRLIIGSYDFLSAPALFFHTTLICFSCTLQALLMVNNWIRSAILSLAATEVQI